MIFPFTYPSHPAIEPFYKEANLISVFKKPKGTHTHTHTQKLEKVENFQEKKFCCYRSNYVTMYKNLNYNLHKLQFFSKMSKNGI